MATSVLELTNSFADETKRKIEIGPFNSTTLNPATVKSAILDLNSDPSVIAAAYLSDGGAQFTGVIAAQIISTTETEINLNVTPTEEEGE